MKRSPGQSRPKATRPARGYTAAPRLPARHDSPALDARSAHPQCITIRLTGIHQASCHGAQAADTNRNEMPGPGTDDDPHRPSALAPNRRIGTYFSGAALEGRGAQMVQFRARPYGTIRISMSMGYGLAGQCRIHPLAGTTVLVLPLRGRRGAGRCVRRGAVWRRDRQSAAGACLAAMCAGRRLYRLGLSASRSSRAVTEEQCRGRIWSGVDHA